MLSVRMRVTAALAVLAATVVTACGESASSPGRHNAADVSFAQNMIPHHQQAVDLSAMVPSHTTNRKLIVLAEEISSDQRAEIDMLQDLLAEWGQPLAPDHGSHHEHGGMGVDGMVDAATMTELQSLTDADFDVLWLRSMIRHHRGAIAMAQPEIAQGENPRAVRMAKIIVEWQQYEIARMTSLLSVPM
jgi:uncharacterized protein (DUF305 family)